MTARALIIRPDGSFMVQQIEADLETLRELVGGWIEGVTVHDDGTHVYINEEGKLEGLQQSPVATLIVNHYIPGFASHDVICGTAVFLGSDGGGDEADVPDHVIEVVKHVYDTYVRRSAAVDVPKES